MLRISLHLLQNLVEFIQVVAFIHGLELTDTPVGVQYKLEEELQ